MSKNVSYCVPCLRKFRKKTDRCPECRAVTKTASNGVASRLIARLKGARSRVKKTIREKYAEYLASSLWRSIRSRVLKRDSGICRMCGSVATTVHHTSYANSVKEGNDDSKLVSLCGRCHESIEFTVINGKKTKNSLSQANAKLALNMAEIGERGH